MMVKWKEMAICMATGIFCATAGYICGHATCAHQHVNTEEANQMILNEDGVVDYWKYIKEAFKDYKRMKKDPYGLESGLD